MSKKKEAEKVRERIDFKYNLGLYYSYVKRYRFLFSAVLFLIIITEVLRVVDSFLFKVIYR